MNAISYYSKLRTMKTKHYLTWIQLVSKLVKTRNVSYMYWLSILHRWCKYLLDTDIAIFHVSVQHMSCLWWGVQDVEQCEKHELSSMRNERKLMTLVMIFFLLLHLIDPTMRKVWEGWIPYPKKRIIHLICMYNYNMYVYVCICTRKCVLCRTNNCIKLCPYQTLGTLSFWSLLGHV